VSKGFQWSSAYLITGCEFAASATLSSPSVFSVFVLDSSKNPNIYQVSSIFPPPSANPLQGGWEGIQPNILRPHICLHSCPRRLRRSLPSHRPPWTTHRALPELASLALFSSHAQTCSSCTPFIPPRSL
jgi:hypothetical protein